jgi:intracellular sulfur oxidation DsrE/DsrF family protein
MSDDLKGLAGAKAVWDFTTGDERRFRDRLELVIDAAQEFRRRSIPFDFVLLLHGLATQFAARTLGGTKFADADLSAAHALMQRFCDLGGRIEVCRIALERSGIAEDNVIACAVIERNVFVNAVALQNRGYAYMPIP